MFDTQLVIDNANSGFVVKFDATRPLPYSFIYLGWGGGCAGDRPETVGLWGRQPPQQTEKALTVLEYDHACRRRRGDHPFDKISAYRA